MKTSFTPVRLFVEVSVAIALAETLVMLVLPVLAPGLTGLAEGLVAVTLLILLSGPAVYWRCMAALRRRSASADAATTTVSKSLSLHAAIGMTAAAQLVGLAVTAGVVFWLKLDLDKEAQTLFDRGTERIEAEVKRRFNQPLAGLKGARGAYAASHNITRREFQAYVESRDLPHEFPEVRGFGFIARVQRGDLEAFVARERADFAPEFDVRTQGDAADLFIIKYIEPIAVNRAAFGLDIGQEAVRREAAERAMNTGQPALTGKITLVQDSKQSPGVLYFLPMYRHGANPATPAQHQDALVGLLYAPIIASELFEGLVDAVDQSLRIEVLDGNNPTSGSRLFDSEGVSNVERPAAPQSLGGLSVLSVVRPIAVGGRTLSLRVSSTPAFRATQDRTSLALASLAGALASLLLALTVWLLAVGRLRAQRLAERMTKDLARLARVVQHTTNAVSITDTQMRITWVNEGFTRLTGYSLEEAMGRTPGDLLGSGKSDPKTIQKLLSAVEMGEPCRVEVLNRAKDGHEYWVDTEVQPTRDAEGVLIGFMEIGTDVTVQKQTQKRLEAAIRESSTLLSTVELHNIVSITDRQGTIIEANDRFCDISGYCREELIGQNHRIVNSGMQPAQFWIDVWAVISTGVSWRGDICNRAKDGSLYWVDSMIAPFVGDDGLVEKYVSMRTDITERKHNERQLAEVTDRMTLAIEGGSDGLWDWMDVTQDAQWWAPNYYAQLGYSPQDIPALASSYVTLLHPDSRELSLMAGQDALAGLRPFDVEMQLQTKNQGYRWFRTRAKVYFDDQGRAARMAGTTQDIHDHKLALDALKESEAFLDRAGRIAGVGGWSVELKTGKVHWSKETRRIHEVDDSYEPQLDQAIHFYAPEARPLVEQAVRDGMEQGIAWDLELPFTTAKGRAIWVRTVGEAEFEDGKPVMLVGAFQDITERRLRDQELHLLESCISRIKDSIVITHARPLQEPGPEIVFVNHAFETLTGYSQVETLGRTPRMLQGPDTDPVALARIRSAIARGESVNEELLNYSKDGTPYWIEVSISPVMSGTGEVSHFVAIERDITERRINDAALAERTAQLEAVLDNISQGVAMIAADKSLVIQSRRVMELLDIPSYLQGSDLGKIIAYQTQRGDFGGDFALVEESARPYLRALARGEEVAPPPLYKRKTASGRTLEIASTMLDTGVTVRTFTDVTTYVDAQARAEQASIAKGQFLANMSHEIRTPMNAVLGLLQLLQDTALTDTQLDYVLKTEGAARSLLGLLNDILDFSKIEAGKMTLDPRPFDLDKILRDLAVILGPSASSQSISVRFEVEPAVPRNLIGDDMRLLQVLINLGGNAVKFTHQGGVVLRVRRVEQGASDVLLEFAMCDSGIGIATENQQHIFSGFSQAEASTTRRFGGTGLGLAISSRLVGLLGGDLKLSSVESQGSTFYFQVRFLLAAQPVIRAPTPAKPGNAAALPSRRLQGLRILLVEDNKINQMVAKGLLSKEGADITLADNGQLGVDAVAAAQPPFDAVLMDIQMPVMDGYAATRFIRNNLGLATLPIIAMTANAMASDRTACLEAGMDDHVGKPFELNHLVGTVLRLCAR